MMNPGGGGRDDQSLRRRAKRCHRQKRMLYITFNHPPVFTLHNFVHRFLKETKKANQRIEER